MMKMLERDPIPCWYEISWRPDVPAIALRIHKDIVGTIQEIVDGIPPVITHLTKEFGFGGFSSSLAKDQYFGFGGVLKSQGENDDFLELLITLPVVRQRGEDSCFTCKGTGKESFGEDKCYSCDGTGDEYNFVWQTAMQISATLTVLSTILEHIYLDPEKETSAEFPQLLTFHTVTQGGTHGGSLWGSYSIPLVDWLRSLKSQTTIPELTQAMQEAWNHMMGQKDYDRHSFHAYINNPSAWLIIDCPGDACGLHPSDVAEDGRGCKFSCHNVDTTAQQLTLLVALAALHDKVRKETAL